MTSLSASYKGFVILAQAELVGSGGPNVGADERWYVPLAVVAGAGGTDRTTHDTSQELRLFRAKGRTPMRNPYLAMTTAIQYARQLVDMLAAGPAVGDVPALGEFERGGVQWRCDSLVVAPNNYARERYS
ncbi:hypothetical protein PTE30175_00463 [Pandoraea terrae]|uniref:Uncharacterized protein n=1 Tax=Pandoraea terrae TaxID=1537710 RepID=A0A5E4S125_9BURK|nr:hypothetical protein [Pandoraea terrae]VVD68861.1 hypothetical protein PTE30175_00463 [Pandoraea terrae]